MSYLHLIFTSENWNVREIHSTLSQSPVLNLITVYHLMLYLTVTIYRLSHLMSFCDNFSSYCPFRFCSITPVLILGDFKIHVDNSSNTFNSLTFSNDRIPYWPQLLISMVMPLILSIPKFHHLQNLIFKNTTSNHHHLFIFLTHWSYHLCTFPLSLVLLYFPFLSIWSFLVCY